MLVGLAALPEERWQDESTLIHVSERNGYTLAWLSLLGVPSERVVSGT